MSRLQPNRLKSSRNNSQSENSLQNQRKPRAVGTSDDQGVAIDLRATPGYQDTELTTGDLENQPIADGGSELEADVYRCGGCENAFTDDAALSSYIVEETGEEMNYSSGRCPDCGTPITSDRTLRTTATFELPPQTTEADR